MKIGGTAFGGTDFLVDATSGSGRQEVETPERGLAFLKINPLADKITGT